MRTMMLSAICAIAMIANAEAAIREEPVTYADGETTMKGFVVYDDATEGKGSRARFDTQRVRGRDLLQLPAVAVGITE